MKYFDHPNKRFMAKFDRFEPLIQDHTSMKAAKFCKRNYFYTMVLGFRPRVERNQTIFDIGTAYHKFKEVLRKTAGDFQKALIAAMLKPIATPIYKKWEYLNKGALTQMCYTAYETYLKDQELSKIKLIPDMIEQPLNVQLPDGSLVGGRLDAGVTFMGEIWDMDDKTSSKDPDEFIREKEVDDQATRYIYMLTKLSPTQKVGGIIYDAMHHSYTDKRGLELNNKKHLTSRSQSQLDQWEKEQMLFNQELKLARDNDTWIMEEHGCRYCSFRDVCKRPTEAAQMAVLEQNYVRKPWNFEENGVEESE